MNVKEIFPALERALHYRASYLERLGMGTNAFRLFCGEGEGVPGLIVDRYDRVLILQWHEGKATLSDEALYAIAKWYVSQSIVDSVYLKRFIPDRSTQLAKADLYSAKPLAGSKAPAIFPIKEHGLQYLIRPYSGFSTGLFLDQRENRRHLLEREEGSTILNCFAYTCAFSVGLAQRGMKVTNVDLSKKHLDWGGENFQLNGLEPTAHEFYHDDVFSFLKRAQRRGLAYDLVILDPPSFSRGKLGAFSIRKDFPKLLLAALPVVKNPGGQLFFSSNYSNWNGTYLRKTAKTLLGKEWIFMTLPTVPEDFSPEVNSLSCFLIRR